MLKVSELSGALLDYYVARAEGLRRPEVEGGYCRFDYKVRTGLDAGDIHREIFAPSRDWNDGGPLIEKHNLNTAVAYSGFQKKSGHAAWSNDLDLDYGDTPLQAICRAVVRAAFGDDVEEVGV